MTVCFSEHEQWHTRVEYLPRCFPGQTSSTSSLPPPPWLLLSPPRISLIRITTVSDPITKRGHGFRCGCSPIKGTLMRATIFRTGQLPTTTTMTTMGRNLAAILLVVLACLVSLASAEQIKTTNTRWSYRLPLSDGVSGAESLAFSGKDGVYTGVSDGRVLRWGGSAAGWSTFAYNANYRKIPLCSDSGVPSEQKESICGRPLGVRFYRKTGELIIADAYMGLMKVGPDGGEAQVLATEADGVPFHFLNGLDVDQATGDVYFTDSSANYPRRFNTEIIMNADATGRLLKYDARTKLVTVLKAELPYPNGVALSRDRTHLVVAHTVPCQAFRYWLKGPKAGRYELLADLPGYPDNVRRDGQGGFWVALNQEKARLNSTAAAPVKHLVGVRLSADGVEVEELTAARGVTLSEVAENGNRLWLGSVELDYIGVFA